MSRFILLLMCSALLAAGTGCVSIKTPDVEVEVLNSPPSSWLDSDDDEESPETPYADALRDVIDQQQEVNEEFARRQWHGVIEETGVWIADVRTLSGFADSSHNPAEFRRQCDELLEATQTVRRAARLQDARRFRSAIDACDPLIDRFCRMFPLTEPTAGRLTQTSHPPRATPARDRPAYVVP